MDPHLIRIVALALIGACACLLAALPRTAHGAFARCELNSVTDRHEVPGYADRRTDIVRGDAR